MRFVNNARKAVLYMSVIANILEYLQTQDRELLADIEDSLAILGVDYKHVLYELQPVRAIQYLCKEFGNLELTDEDITKIGDDDSEKR